MPHKKTKLLAVDDDVTCLEILQDTLQKAGYSIVTARNGKEALIQLFENPDIEVIVLDWMMPVMDGMEVLARIKANPQTASIPVIMQTAKVSNESVQQGIEAGVYYYLQKPYDSKVIRALVEAALRDRRNVEHLQGLCTKLSEKTQNFCRAFVRMRSSEFGFRTPAQARMISTVVASCFPDPHQVVVGFQELMMNAIEHGNLGIDFEEKRELLRNGTYDDVLLQRLQQSKHLEKEAIISVKKDRRKIKVVIEDHGKGFDWQRFIELRADRIDAPNGRGIYIASLDFDEIRYEGSGNKVVCIKDL